MPQIGYSRNEIDAMIAGILDGCAFTGDVSVTGKVSASTALLAGDVFNGTMATGDIAGKRLLLNTQVQYPGEGFTQEYNNGGDTSTTFTQVYNSNSSAMHFNLKNGAVTAMSMYGDGGVSVPGTMTFTGSTGEEGIDLTTNDQYLNARVIRNNRGLDRDIYLGFNNNVADGGQLRLYSNGSQSMIVSNGNVGIGTDPSYLLDVQGTINTAGDYYVAGIRVVGAQQTAISDPFGVSIAEDQECRQAVGNILIALRAHGLIGTA